MAHGTKDFAAKITDFKSTMKSDEERSVGGLRGAYESWARMLLGIGDNVRLIANVRRIVEAGLDPELAAEVAEKFAGAEEWQWVIGSWATGSGEGLSSMFEVRTLQLARAWVLAAGLPDRGDLPEVRRLALEVKNASNGVANTLQSDVDALLARINQLSDGAH